jgi:hypothetical protein
MLVKKLGWGTHCPHWWGCADFENVVGEVTIGEISNTTKKTSAAILMYSAWKGKREHRPKFWG